MGGGRDQEIRVKGEEEASKREMCVCPLSRVSCVSHASNCWYFCVFYSLPFHSLILNLLFFFFLAYILPYPIFSFSPFLSSPLPSSSSFLFILPSVSFPLFFPSPLPSVSFPPLSPLLYFASANYMNSGVLMSLLPTCVQRCYFYLPSLPNLPNLLISPFFFFFRLCIIY